MKLIRDLYAGALMLSTTKTFYPEKEYRNMRVAIVGAADSIFEQKNGAYIDQHDLVVRVNKAPFSWSAERAEFTGTKFTHLYHSYFENSYSGGGSIDWNYYDSLGIEKVINPLCSREGLTAHLNYYKRHHSSRKTYMLARENYKKFERQLESFIPTVGFSALMSVLQSDFKEVFITGFTFFKTPYVPGYRDHLINTIANNEHIKKQGRHNPDLEFEVLCKELEEKKNVSYDLELERILTGAFNGST